MTIIATIGAVALYLLLIWLGSAIVASYLSQRKGYGDKIGLACGLFLSLVGAIVWLLVPAKADSDWKVVGPLPPRRGKTEI